jgi:small GTP-binding protein
MATKQRRRHGGQAVKVVITGPFAAGKTTLIRTISEITVLSTERGITDSTKSRKNETTVAMDFGRITIDRELVLYLFGTPGQERFDFMWEILGEGMLGYVLLLDANRPDSLAEAVGILEAFRRMARVPFVVALNRTTGVDEVEEARIRQTLGIDSNVAVVPCDATDKESVKAVLLALLYSVLDEVETVTAGVLRRWDMTCAGSRAVRSRWLRRDATRPVGRARLRPSPPLMSSRRLRWRGPPFGRWSPHPSVTVTRRHRCSQAAVSTWDSPTVASMSWLPATLG